MTKCLVIDLVCFSQNVSLFCFAIYVDFISTHKKCSLQNNTAYWICGRQLMEESYYWTQADVHSPQSTLSHYSTCLDEIGYPLVTQALDECLKCIAQSRHQHRYLQQQHLTEDIIYPVIISSPLSPGTSIGTYNNNIWLRTSFTQSPHHHHLVLAPA